MTERLLHPTLPGMSKIEMLEAMSKEGLVDHIVALGIRGEEIQTDMNLASEVLEGAHGVSIEDALKEREQQNGDPAA